jgi:very-short-patch-repair endonuclease
MRKKITTEEFIKKAQLVHGDKYKYHHVEYTGCKNKINIICDKHGVFKQTPDKHLSGHGCDKCVGYGKTTKDFIISSKLIHGDKYDYSNVKYCGMKTNVNIICNIHGVFTQTPDDHLHGRGCYKCGYDKNSKYFSSTTNEFIEKSKLIHGDKYDYSKTNYVNAKNKITIVCRIHGEFTQTPTNHLSGKGCKLCSESKGELIIKKYLDVNNVKYIREKTFDECKNKFKLFFDFYLPEKNILVEYDGEQHYKSIDFFGGRSAFEKLKTNDNIKNNFARANGIQLLRIKFNEINNIDKILKNII